jgi:hypothetical protein
MHNFQRSFFIAVSLSGAGCAAAAAWSDNSNPPAATTAASPAALA